MSQSKSNEQVLANEPWYHGLLPREEMKVLLTQRGDFLIRFTDPKVGEPRKFVLSIFVGTTTDILHYVIQEHENKFAVDAKWFNSIPELLNYHHRCKEPVAAACSESVLIRPIGREPWEKQHSDVTLIKKLGEGAFGEVQLGEIRIGNTVKKAAIKLAKLEALTKEQIKEIMHEARLMRKFKHPNVVTFYGVAAGQEPLMVIMELADNGALDSYLKKNIGCLLIKNKNNMIMQAARGLEYLHSLQVIHRDIASRNCLYGNGQVKISDFGLSREGTNYRLNPNKKVPIRWLAPEVPRTGFYTAKTDVFAYGIMCWEVYQDGTEPYPGMKVVEVLPRVQEGYRMGFGPHVPEKVAQYITERVCSGTDEDRVTMSDVVRQLPGIEGFEQDPHSNSYFSLPGEAKSPNKDQNEAALEAKRSPIHCILPYNTQPVEAPPHANVNVIQQLFHPTADEPKNHSEEAPKKISRKPVKSPSREGFKSAAFSLVKTGNRKRGSKSAEKTRTKAEKTSQERSAEQTLPACELPKGKKKNKK